VADLERLIEGMRRDREHFERRAEVRRYLPDAH
jgi:hypothetical protein